MRHTNLIQNDANIFIDRGVDFYFGKNSKLIINSGILKVGGTHPKSTGMPSLNRTIIALEENSQFIIDGDCYIASGSYFALHKGSTLFMNGKNYIGHDNKFFVHDYMSIGKNVSTSWNVTLIEDDGHHLFDMHGRIVKKIKKNMIIEDNVGIQMNVTIPRGVKVGENSLIGANSVIRKDVSPNTLVYSDILTREKHGFSAGLQFS